MNNTNKFPLVVKTNISIADNIYNVFERFREYIISNNKIGEDLEEEEVIFVGGNDGVLIFKTSPSNENLFANGLEYDYKITLPVNCFKDYTVYKKHRTGYEIQAEECIENLLSKINIKFKYCLNKNIKPTLNYYRIYGKEDLPPNYTKEFNGEICTISIFGETINVKVLDLDGTVIDHTYQTKDLANLTDIQLSRVGN